MYNLVSRLKFKNFQKRNKNVKIDQKWFIRNFRKIENPEKLSKTNFSEIIFLSFLSYKYIFINSMFGFKVVRLLLRLHGLKLIIIRLLRRYFVSLVLLLTFLIDRNFISTQS